MASVAVASGNSDRKVLPERRPGIIGQHLHMLTMWALAFATIPLTHTYILAFGAMGLEMIDQCEHARNNHPTDWRAKRWANDIALALLIGAPLPHLLTMNWRVSLLEVIALAVYAIGQWTVSATWHRVAHKAARHRVSANRWGKTIRRMLIGLMIMAWGLYIVL